MASGAFPLTDDDRLSLFLELAATVYSRPGPDAAPTPASVMSEAKAQCSAFGLIRLIRRLGRHPPPHEPRSTSTAAASGVRRRPRPPSVRPLRLGARDEGEGAYGGAVPDG